MTNEGKQVLFKSISRIAVPDAVVNEVREMMESGRLRPGDRLPSERELSQQLGVARTSVREALRILRALGLVIVQKGKGTYVAGPELRSQETFADLMLAKTAYTLEEVVDVRFALECRAAELACMHASDADIKEVRESVGRLRKAAEAGDLTELVVADTAFHNAIVRSSRNGLLARMFSLILEYAVRYRRTGWSTLTPEARVAQVDDHERLCNAISRRDIESSVTITRRMLFDFARQAGLNSFETG